MEVFGSLGDLLGSGKAKIGSHVWLGHISLTGARDSPPDHTVHFPWVVLGHRSNLILFHSEEATGTPQVGLRVVHRGSSSDVLLLPGFAINWGRAEWNDRSAYQLGSVPAGALL